MKENGFNRNQLKYIAALAMLFDHIGMYFFPVTTTFGLFCRIVGRITAPIMCYFVAEGYFYTKSKKKYGIRLFVFALISQFAYSYSHYYKLFTLNFNVIFTFFIGFLMLLSYDKIQNKVLKWITVTALILVSNFGDWGVIAPLWILMFWVYRDNMKKKLISYTVIALLMIFSSVIFMLSAGCHWYGELWQLGTFLCIPLIINYNGKGTNKSAFDKWFFYIFYPVHLLILGLIRLYIG